MLEKDIEAAVCKYAKSKGFEAYKFSSPARVGVPDRLFLGPCQRVFFVEFKREGGKPTPMQVREAERIMGFGISVYLVDSIEEGKAIVDEQFDIAQSVMQMIKLSAGGDNATHH